MTVSAAVSELGDIAILSPVAFLILLWLILQKSYRDAARWAAAVTLCVGGISFLKIFFYACPPMPKLDNPSGHAGFGTLVYGAIALIVAAEGGARLRFVAIGAGASLVLAIAFSRIFLNVHTQLETAVGFAIGLGALTFFACGYLQHSHLIRKPLLPLVFTAALLIAALHGRTSNAEEMLHAISDYLHVRAIACS